MDIDVVWYTREQGRSCRGFWDQGWLEEILSGSMWGLPADLHFTHRYGFSQLPSSSPGAIVVIPARHHLDDIDDINTQVARLDWVFWVLTGDEEGVFPWKSLRHRRSHIWVQTPQPNLHEGISQAVGDFTPPSTRQSLASLLPPDAPKPLPWSFVGQNNNTRRSECVTELRRLCLDHPGGVVIPTEGFTLGLSRLAYLAILASSRIAACPSGPFTPDTFRIFEALEAGCVPIADSSAPNIGDIGYWRYLFGEEVTFPVLEYWDDFGVAAEEILNTWPVSANRVFAQWQGYKRKLVQTFLLHLAQLCVGDDAVFPAPSPITVIIPTSPIPSHPDTSIIEATVSSIRERLGEAEILVCIDGIREEQEHYRPNYEEYQRRLLWLCNNVWSNVLPIRHESHQHQANLAHHALDYIRTPLLMFVEHDTPLTKLIPFPELCRPLLNDEADVVRLYHETVLQPEHEWMMMKGESRLGPAFTRTFQWSQRPHIARVDYYRRILHDCFDLPRERWMIEDRMHSVVQVAAEQDTLTDHRIYIYTPEGNIQRSTHLDGRGGDEKWVDR